MRRMLAAAITLIGVSTAMAAAPRGEAPEAIQDNRPRVLVLPFEELADAPKRGWVGKAMQQSLVAELTRSGLVAVVTPAADAVPAKDAAAAAKLARDVHAPLVIIGSYQLIDQELRVTGQMLESINGEPVAGIKATGNLRDLFGIEDIIGGQVRRDLQVILQPPPTTNPSGDPFKVQPSGPVQQQPPTGSYVGSELQRSLDDQWTPPVAPYLENGRDRNRYGYPTPPYYPPYGYHDYYDWCGYNPWPIIIRPGLPVVPPGPGPTRTTFPQNNYAIHPPHTIQGHPGQMGRQSGGISIQGEPGQQRGTGSGSGGSGQGGGSNQVGPSGQSGRTSSGNTMRNASSR